MKDARIGGQTTLKVLKFKNDCHQNYDLARGTD